MVVASVFSQMRSIGVPLGMEDPDHPNIAATLWRTVADHDARRCFFESALRPAIFWVDLDKLNLDVGAEVMKLETLGPKVLGGEVSSEFQPAEPFKFVTSRQSPTDQRSVPTRTPTQSVKESSKR